MEISNRWIEYSSFSDVRAKTCLLKVTERISETLEKPFPISRGFPDKRPRWAPVGPGASEAPEGTDPPHVCGGAGTAEPGSLRSQAESQLFPGFHVKLSSLRPATQPLHTICTYNYRPSACSRRRDRRTFPRAAPWGTEGWGYRACAFPPRTSGHFSPPAPHQQINKTG